MDIISYDSLLNYKLYKIIKELRNNFNFHFDSLSYISYDIEVFS